MFLRPFLIIETKLTINYYYAFILVFLKRPIGFERVVERLNFKSIYKTFVLITQIIKLYRYEANFIGKKVSPEYSIYKMVRLNIKPVL